MSSPVESDSQTASITKGTLIYGLSAVISQAVLLLGAPIFTRQLGPAGFGTLELLIVALHLGGTILVAGLDTATIRHYYRSDDPLIRRSMVSSALWFVVGAALLGGGAVILLRAPLARSWLSSGTDTTVLLAGGAALTTLVIARYSRELLRAQHRPTAYLLNAVAASVIQVGAGVALIVVFDLGVSGVMIGYAAAGLLTGAWALYSSRGFIRLRSGRWEALRPLLSFGLPLVWSGLAGWSLMFIDRFLLQALAGVEEVGIYALAYRIASVTTVAIYAFNRAWTPAILAEAERDLHRARSMQGRALTAYLIPVGWLVVAIAAWARPLVLLLGGAEYEAATQLIPVLAIGIALLAPIPVIQSSMLIHMGTRAIGWASVLAAVVNVAANLVLIPRFGPMGASWATFLAFAIQLALYWWLARRIDVIDYGTDRLLRLVSVVGLLVAVAWFTRGAGGLTLAIPILLTVGYPLLVSASGVVPFQVLRRLPRDLSKALRRDSIDS